MMRLDKFLSVTATCSRKDAKTAVRKGAVTVNGTVPKTSDVEVDETRDTIVFGGQTIRYRAHVYLLLHKPAGYVSATRPEQGAPCVLSLLPPEVQKNGLFPCGRLDKNTTGLLLMTDDGDLAHKMLSPKRHVEKEYAFTVKFPLSQEDVSALENGVEIGTPDTPEKTAPCRLLVDADRLSGRIVLTEGKFHEIKRMMEVRHNQITRLTRVRFAAFTLDTVPNEGDWRRLSEEEEAELLASQA